MIEDGQTYDTLRGVSFEGVAEIVDDPDAIFRVGVSVWERYTGPYTDEMKPAVDMMMNKRVAVRIVSHRTRSWDHRKLGIPQMPVGGSTAPAAELAGHAARLWMSSPDGIRTHATAVRGRRPRPLDDGAGTDPSSQHSSQPYAHLIARRWNELEKHCWGTRTRT